MLSDKESSFSIDVFKIPVKYLEEAKSVCFQSFNYEFGSFDPALEKFWSFEKESYIEKKSVDELQIAAWKSDVEAGRRKFWYSHTCHILSKQSIDVSLAEIITCSI